MLEAYFQKLIERVEREISNQGKDENGFFKPTKTILVRHLNTLKDLHNKPLAKDIVKASWQSVSENLPLTVQCTLKYELTPLGLFKRLDFF